MKHDIIRDNLETEKLRITATVLRWPREEIESFALHLLGDEWQGIKAERDALKGQLALAVKDADESRIAASEEYKGREKAEAERDALKLELADVRQEIVRLEMEIEERYGIGMGDCKREEGMRLHQKGSPGSGLTMDN